MEFIAKFGTLWIALDVAILATFWYVKNTFPSWWDTVVCDVAPENLD